MRDANHNLFTFQKIELSQEINFLKKTKGKWEEEK
jgi:hypothetical protein